MLLFFVLVDRSFNVSRGASSNSTALAIVLLALNYILSRWTRAVVMSREFIVVYAQSYTRALVAREP